MNDVTLFGLSVSDVSERYVAWLNDPEVNRFLESRHSIQNAESVRKYVEQCIDDPNSHLMGIRYRPLNDLHVGNVRLILNPHHRQCEIGILIGEKKAWGHGVASGAIKLAMEFAESRFSIEKFTAGMYAGNEASVASFRKAGFFVECVRKHHLVLEGRRHDLVLMASFVGEKP